MRYLLCFLLVQILCLPVPASARDQYWIDLHIAGCKGEARGLRVLAAASVGASFCIWGYPAAQEKAARAEAIRLCNREIKGPARQLTSCHVVWSNGRIVAPTFYQAMARDFRVPVKIKSWNGQSKEEINYDGYMIAGKSRMTGPDQLENHARIVLKDGTEICNGLLTPVGVGITFTFRATCLGNLVLSGRGRIKGAVKVDGQYRYAAFTATISNPPHKMEVWTP